jgi:hypothetical protein
VTTHGTHDGSRIEAEEAAEHDPHHDDDHGSHGGHGADPNEGVVRGVAPTPAWVWTATLVGLVTIVLCVLLALRIG